MTTFNELDVDDVFTVAKAGWKYRKSDWNRAIVLERPAGVEKPEIMSERVMSLKEPVSYVIKDPV